CTSVRATWRSCGSTTTRTRTTGSRSGWCEGASALGFERWRSRSNGSMAMRFDLTRALEVLERTPGTSRALLGGLSEAWTTPNEGPETFSAWDNVGHLVHAERTNWIPRARVILEQGPDRAFPPFDRFG